MIHKSKSTQQVQSTETFSLAEKKTRSLTPLLWKYVFFLIIEDTHPSRIVVVTVYAEHRNGNIQVFILIVNPGESTKQ